MTEDEAKTKPCIGTNAFNVGRPERLSDDTIVYRCIASACMAWRLGRDSNDNPSSKRGFCGLAGKP